MFYCLTTSRLTVLSHCPCVIVRTRLWVPKGGRERAVLWWAHGEFSRSHIILPLGLLVPRDQLFCLSHLHFARSAFKFSTHPGASLSIGKGIHSKIVVCSLALDWPRSRNSRIGGSWPKFSLSRALCKFPWSPPSLARQPLRCPQPRSPEVKVLASSTGEIFPFNLDSHAPQFSK